MLPSPVEAQSPQRCAAVAKHFAKIQDCSQKLLLYTQNNGILITRYQASNQNCCPLELTCISVWGGNTIYNHPTEQQVCATATPKCCRSKGPLCCLI